MNKLPWLEASEVAMWALVNRYTGRVGYQAGAKATALNADPPVIDCSGWAALLLSAAMKAANHAVAAELFSNNQIASVHTWSDRMIHELEQQFGWVLQGNEITLAALPPLATIGLRQGGGAWASNRPRPRGITHVVQVVRRPDDGASFVSEAQGWSKPPGLRLTPLAAWLDLTQAHLKLNEAWAVDAFAAPKA